MEDIWSFIYNRSFSDWLAFFALLISIVNLILYVVINKSGNDYKKLQTVQKIIEFLNRDKWELFHVIEKTKEFHSGLIRNNVESPFADQITKMEQQLKLVDEYIDTFDEMFDKGVALRHDKLLAIHSTTTSMLINTETLNKSVTPKIKMNLEKL